MNTTELPNEVIATLAEFKGWEYDGIMTEWILVSDGVVSAQYSEEQLSEHFTDPRTLIALRNETWEKFINSVNLIDGIGLSIAYNEIGKLILEGDYQAAAIKAAEIIKKLKPDV